MVFTLMDAPARDALAKHALAKHAPYNLRPVISFIIKTEGYSCIIREGIKWKR
jgi:hypothetical protein